MKWMNMFDYEYFFFDMSHEFVITFGITEDNIFFQLNVYIWFRKTIV